jgi:hypothetical protein
VDNYNDATNCAASFRRRGIPVSYKKQTTGGWLVIRKK